MITTNVEGDLIQRAKEGRYFGIAHGANCQNVMKSGIAPKICRAFPGTREADLETVKGCREKLGTYSESYCEEFDLHVFNLYTQFHWNGRTRGERDLDYGAVANAFYWLDQHYGNEQQRQSVVKPVGIPMIGAGLAGGDWEAIYEIINLSTPKLELELVILPGG